MNQFVKTVFLTIMGVVAAMLLYLFLFGNRNLDGDNLYMGTANYHWKGALWYAAEQLETPIAKYYYEYCFLPNIHSNDYVDEALDGSKSSTYYKNGNLQLTETNLSGNNDLYTFGSSSIPHYSTGWR